MTRKDFFVKLINFCSQPGNNRLSLAATMLYILILYISGKNISSENNFWWIIFDIWGYYIEFGALGLLTYQSCLFTTKKFLQGDITINKILIFCLITWSICIPICLWIELTRTGGIYETLGWAF